MAITTTTKKSITEERHKISFLRSSSVAIAAIILSPLAGAAEWRFTPLLDLRETYTDNVRLAPSGSEKSDFITEVSPGFNLTANGPRLTFNSRYALQYLRYANDPGGSSISHQLSAASKAELIDKFFFIDGAASISQQNISPLGPQPVDNRNITGNRATVRTATISPYLLHDFGSVASTQARYTHTNTTTSTESLGRSETDALLFRVNSGRAFRTLGWGLQYTRQRFDSGNIEPVNSMSASGNLRYMVTPRFDLTATGGREKFDYASPVTQPEGSFYTAGFSWRPTDRTSLDATVGRRFFGRTFSLESSVRSRMAAWRVAYNEDITTTQSQFAAQASNSTSDFLNQLFLPSVPDPVLRQQTVDRFMLSNGLSPVLSQSSNYFTNQFFLQKSLQASVGIAGARNSVVLSVFDILRKPQTALGALPGSGAAFLDADTRQAGASAMWGWTISPRTSGNFNTSYSRMRQVSTDTEQRLKSFRVSIARQFQPNLSGMLELRRQNQSSDLAGGSYRENAISVMLSMKF